MKPPKISWYVLEDYGDNTMEFIQKKKHEEDDSVMPGESITIRMQVWNNRNGLEDVTDASDSRLMIYFKNYEDNFLLNLCSVKLGSGEHTPVNVDIDRGYFDIGTISGKANNGSELNAENYFELELKIGPIPSNVKSELKDLVLDIEYSDISQ